MLDEYIDWTGEAWLPLDWPDASPSRLHVKNRLNEPLCRNSLYSRSSTKRREWWASGDCAAVTLPEPTKTAHQTMSPIHSAKLELCFKYAYLLVCPFVQFIIKRWYIIDCEYSWILKGWRTSNVQKCKKRHWRWRTMRWRETEKR